MERRLRDITEVSDNQFEFMSGRSTMKAIYFFEESNRKVYRKEK